MQGQKVEQTTVIGGLVRNLNAKNATVEAGTQPVVAAPAYPVMRLFAEAPSAAPVIPAPALALALAAAPDLADIPMDGLLDRIIDNYDSPATQDVAANALKELQTRLRDDQNLYGALQVYNTQPQRVAYPAEYVNYKKSNFNAFTQRYETYFTKPLDYDQKIAEINQLNNTNHARWQRKCEWLLILSPQVKVCVNLFAAIQNIFNSNWHDKGTGTLGIGGRTPDTIKDCRKLIVASNKQGLIVGAPEKDTGYCGYTLSYINNKFIFKYESIHRLMSLLQTLVAQKPDKKYDELKGLLNVINTTAPRDLEACINIKHPERLTQITYK